MFRKLNSDDQGTLTFFFGGKPIKAHAGDTVATALLAAGYLQFRTTLKNGVPRGPYCLMGSCFECTVEIDGQARRQACLEPAIEGMRVSSTQGDGHE